jgi:hypothetical protein
LRSLNLNLKKNYLKNFSRFCCSGTKPFI